MEIPRYYALPKEIGPQPDRTFGSWCEAVWSAPPWTAAAVRKLTAGLDQSAARSRREPLRNPRWAATDHEDICRIQQPRTLPLQK